MLCCGGEWRRESSSSSKRKILFLCIYQILLINCVSYPRDSTNVLFMKDIEEVIEKNGEK
jgi:hypothetical protein